MTAYYNEFDKNAAAWLRELIADGLIALGDVDERSIIDVSADDVKGYDQCHWFAGIGGWSYALRLAGWQDDRQVWTASLPCQPFSIAGKELGKQDERHLLPHFLELVKQCRPSIIFGEQVSAAIKHGWLDDLYTEMEAYSYAVGSVVIGAHSIGAAHIRQRLYWVADSLSYQREQQPDERSTRLLGTSIQSEECVSGSSDIRTTSDGGMVYANESRSQQRIETAAPARYRGSVESAGISSGLHDTESQRRDIHNPEDVRPTNGKGYSLANSSDRIDEQSSVMRTPEIDWLYCRDGKYRPIESGLKPLVDGVPRGMVHSSDPRNTQEARAIRLKGYGNAIVPALASEFIAAFMDCKK